MSVEEPATQAELDAERRIWTPEEDSAIRTLVANFGTKNWSLIAENIVKDYGIIGRSGKQCRERWHNHLGEKACNLLILRPYSLVS
jgi:hypothetical protein